MTKLCMIGVRGHNGYVLSALPRLPHVRVAAISPGVEGDDTSGLARLCEERGQRPEVVADYRTMLDRVKPDVVSVAGPFERHAEMCLEAFGRGIHVFSEKPVATTKEDLRRLRRAQAAAGVHFAGMMGLRYDPAFHAAWRAVREGAAGAVRLITAQKSYKFGTRPDYYRSRPTYGGTIPWVGSHAIDWIYWFSGVPFRTVYAAQSALHNRGYGELEMSALCHFTLEGEVFASASIEYLRPSTAPTHGDDRVRVAGTEGVIEVRGGEVWLVREGEPGARKLEAACERQIFQDFIDHIEGKRPAWLGPRDTFDVTEACLLARQSADEGRIVRFEEEGNHAA